MVHVIQRDDKSGFINLALLKREVNDLTPKF